MANSTTLIFLIILSAPLFQTVKVQAQQTQKHSNISLGSSLTPTTNSSWLSPSGLYAFGFYPECNGYVVGVFMVGIPEQTVVWTANRDSAPVSSNATLALTSEGSLITQQPQTQDISITGLSQPASSASMFDSGNFVLYDSNDDIIWQSFDHATDTILPGQLLKGEDQGLVSSASETDHSSGIFFLVMLNNGNLIQMSTTAALPSPDYIYWQTNTQGNGITLNLDAYGRLYLCDATNNNIHNVTDAEPPTKEVKIYMMKIDVDGIFRVYSRAYPKGKWSIWWYSTTDKCAPQGLCGLNGYCVLNDMEANCKCLPQFAPLVPGKWSAGCVSNFIAQNCKDSNGSTGYKMSQLDNIVWEELSYWWRHVSSKECEDACLQDCNCDVAQYKDGLCKKQRLPLRFGRRSPGDTRFTFIKVGTSEEPKTQPIPGAQDNPPMKAKKKLLVDILIIGISLGGLGFMVWAISGVLVYKNHFFLAYKKIPNEKGELELGEDVPLRTFTLAELEQVTNGFKEVLGKGAFGTVFKGIISYNSKDVAVKRLDKVSTEGKREFQTEIKVIGRTHHRNLVHLIGYCLDGPHRLLVYEYMSNGSLADFISTAENRPSWDKRIGIALDVARGILYLHEECETQIIHCDIKPQNILMDEHGRAKISDFGLAKLLKPGQAKSFMGIRGTRGYVAPEWHKKLPITVKADIYSFGVMLLEIICWRLDLSLFEEQIILEKWVYDCFEAKELGKLVGDENVDMRKLERMVKVGLWCIQDRPSLRPSMKKVMMMLEGIVNVPMPPNLTSFQGAI